MPDPGPFLSALDWISRVPQVPMNILRGRGGAALRQGVDLLGDVADTILPYDVIDHISTPEDFTSFHELTGIDPKESPATAKIADLLGETALNPFSYIVGGAAKNTGRATARFMGSEIPLVEQGIQKGKDLLKAGYEKLPQDIQEQGRGAAQTVRRTMNWLDMKPEQRAFLERARGEGDKASRAAIRSIEETYKGLTPKEVNIVSDLVDKLEREGMTDASQFRVLQNADSYLQSIPDIRPDAVKNALAQRNEIMNNMRDESLSKGIFEKRPESLLEDEYMQRQFIGPDITNNASALAARKESLKTPEGLLDYLQKNPEVSLERNALSRDLNRASQQGPMAQKAFIGRELFPGVAKADKTAEQFALANPKHKEDIATTIEEMAKTDPDYAYVLGNMFNGMPARKGLFFNSLAKANKVFKSAATYGIILPRIAFHTRNRVSNLLGQIPASEEGRKTFFSNASRVLSDLFGAWDDGYRSLTGSRLTSSELTKSLDEIDKAFKNSKGSTAYLKTALKDDPLALEALDMGVLNNFVSSEELLRRMTSNTKWAKVKNFTEWPAEIGQGLEQRIRLGTYKDLRKLTKEDGTPMYTPDEAARITKETALDYDVPGVANRTFRDIIPFGAFMSQNLPQQAKFLAKRPVAGVVASQFFGEDENNIKYPWMEGQMSIPSGLDEEGNPQYLTSIGLPIEALSGIPGGFDSGSYKDIVGAMHPLLKTPIASMTGIDPFTGGQFGTYEKIAGVEAGDLGRKFNTIASTGLIQPLTSLLQPITLATDDRKSPFEKIMQGTSYLRQTSVDPDLAERQQVESLLRDNPDVRQYHGYFTPQGEEADPQVQQLQMRLRAAKAALKAKREAAAL